MIFLTRNFLIPITLLLSILLAGNATSPNTEDVADLMAGFVACLPVVSGPPNNFSITFSPKSKCSNVTTFVFFTPTGDGRFRIFSLVRHPPILDFPLNLSRVYLFPSVCLGNTTRSLESTTVECRGELVSELEQAIRECNTTVIAEQCWGLCEKHVPSKKTVDVKVINGSLLCHRHGIYQDKPVEFSGKSVSKLKDALQQCNRIIKGGGCTDEKCCQYQCKKQLPYAKTMDVSYRVTNGTPLCYCHAIYQGKPGSCAIMLNF